MLQSVKRNLIYIISSVDIFAVSLVVPLYTQYLKSMKFSNVRIGILNSLYSGVQFFASPVVGHLSDLHGSRLVLIISLLICSSCYPIMGLTVSFVAIACVRMLIGTVKHTQLLCKNYIEEGMVPISEVNTFSSKPDQDDLSCDQDIDVDINVNNKCDGDGGSGIKENEVVHAHSFGKLSAFMSLGYIVGPVISGYFVDSSYGFTFMCFVTGILFVLNSCFAYCLPIVQLSPTKTEANVIPRNFVTSFKNIPWSTCWDLFLLKSLTVFAVFSFYLNYNTSVSSRYGVSTVHLGYSLSLQGLVRAVTGFATHPIYNLFPTTFDASSKIRVVYLVLTSNLAVLYFSTNFYAYLACLVPFNACLSFIRIVNHDALVERIKGRNKGIILGAFNNVTAVSRFILPLISGYLADLYGPDSAYFVSIASLLVAICVISFPSPSPIRPKTE